MRPPVMALLGILALAALLLVLSGRAPDPLRELLGQRCSLAVAGTALALTFDGDGAAATCDLNEALPGPGGGSWYRLDSGQVAADRVLVCRTPNDAGQMVSVYDDGALMLYGHEVCASLSDR